MDGTIIQQGRFTSTGNAEQLQIRSDFDWIRTYNETAIIQNAADLGVEFYFQRGMTNGRGLFYSKLGAVANDPVTVGQIAASSGFTLLDTSGNPLLTAVAITAATNLVRPVVSTADTAGLAAGDVVRLTGVTGAESLSGYDFTIDTIVAGVSFRIAGALATAPGAAGTAGAYRKISFDPLYFPRHRFIANIVTTGLGTPTAPVITLTVRSGYAVGQQVRFIIPADQVANTAVYGMTELDGLVGTITAVDDAIATQSITVNIDTTGFTAFTFPDAAQAATPISKAMVVPIGMDTAQAITSSVNVLSDATDNEGFIGVELAAGNDSPAGTVAAPDIIYWVAGKSFSVTNL